MKKLILLSVILVSVVITVPMSAEEVRLTTIVPDQTTLRVKNGAVGTNYSKPATSIPADTLLVEGNVGIGTTTPGAKLAVVGNATITGNVGIGTKTPGAKLDIAGVAGTDGIRFPDATIQTTAAGEPDYDSGWFYVNHSSQAHQEIARAHGLRQVPRNMMLWQCGGISGADPYTSVATTRTVLAGTRGYQAEGAFINPVTITADSANIYISICGTWWAWGYWSPTSFFCYTGDADGNPRTAYYRIFAWK